MKNKLLVTSLVSLALLTGAGCAAAAEADSEADTETPVEILTEIVPETDTENMEIVLEKTDTENMEIMSENAEDVAEAVSPESILEKMSTQEKVAQVILPAFRYYTDEKGEKQDLTQITEDVSKTLEKHGFAGVILFAQNTGDTEKTVRLVDDMQKANAAVEGRPQLLMAADQEGGPVIRLGHGLQMTGSMAIGAVADPAVAEQAGHLLGEELAAVGINYDAAPVVDVNNNPNNPVIGIRSFSDDPQLVAQMGIGVMKGIQSTGVISTLKHFPGHGDTDTDSHTGLPCVEKDYEELKNFELIPFQACIDAGAEVIMTAHIQYPEIEKQTAVSVDSGEEIALPATLSHTILTDILRGDMGFDGVIISDAMEMQAIATHFDPMDVARMALEAGVNIILMPVDTSTPEGLDALDQYIADVAAMADDGTIAMEKLDDSVLRILKLKEKHGLLKPYDSEDLDKRIEYAIETVGSADHHAQEAEIAEKAITLLKNEKDLLPLQDLTEKTLILVPLDTEVLSAQYTVETLQSEGKLPEDAQIRVEAYSSFNKECLTDVKHLIAVSAIYSTQEMDPWTESGAYSLLLDKVIPAVQEAGGDVTVISAQLPYDANRYTQADAVVLAWYAKGMPEDPRTAEGAVASYGPNLPAALRQILSKDGTFPGKLPVNLPEVDADGHFK